MEKDKVIIKIEEFSSYKWMRRAIVLAKYCFDEDLEEIKNEKCEFQDNWDLFCIKYSRQDLLNLKFINIGNKTLDVLEKVLSDHGLFLKEENKIAKTKLRRIIKKT